MVRIEGQSAPPCRDRVPFRGGYVFKNDKLDAQGRRLDGKTRKASTTGKAPTATAEAARPSSQRKALRPGRVLDLRGVARDGRAEYVAEIATLPGLRCRDVSAGAELLPIPCTNTVDDEPAPSFEYLAAQRDGREVAAARQSRRVGVVAEQCELNAQGASNYNAEGALLASEPAGVCEC